MKLLNNKFVMLCCKRVCCSIITLFLVTLSLGTFADKTLDKYSIQLNSSKKIVKASEKNGIYYILNEKDEADYSLGNNSETYPLENNKSKYESVKIPLDMIYIHSL